ncbi:hypothetical protein EV424DRAFT_1354387 [Suillus variegatus]|nr:hypothetical protein EV424DRAFT_1354387 [Suillus variegatus]
MVQRRIIVQRRTKWLSDLMHAHKSTLHRSINFVSTYLQRHNPQSNMAPPKWTTKEQEEWLEPCNFFADLNEQWFDAFPEPRPDKCTTVGPLMKEEWDEAVDARKHKLHTRFKNTFIQETLKLAEEQQPLTKGKRVALLKKETAALYAGESEEVKIKVKEYIVAQKNQRMQNHPETWSIEDQKHLLVGGPSAELGGLIDVWRLSHHGRDYLYRVYPDAAELKGEQEPPEPTAHVGITTNVYGHSSKWLSPPPVALSPPIVCLLLTVSPPSQCVASSCCVSPIVSPTIVSPPLVSPPISLPTLSAPQPRPLPCRTAKVVKRSADIVESGSRRSGRVPMPPHAILLQTRLEITSRITCNLRQLLNVYAKLKQQALHVNIRLK